VCTFGNTPAENTFKNGAGLLTLSGKTDVPLIQGAVQPYKQHPIETETVSAGDFVGENGLLGIELPVDEKLADTAVSGGDLSDRIDRIVKLIKEAGPLTYIITGPCATFAHVLDALGEDASTYIEKVIIMGGALDVPGNHGPINPETNESYAEFNFYCDPHAAQKVVTSGLDIELVMWDLTQDIVLPYEELSKLEGGGAIGAFTYELMSNFFRDYGLEHGRSFEFNDVVTLYTSIQEAELLTECVDVVVEGEAAGKLQRSATGGDVRVLSLPVNVSAELPYKILEGLSVREPLQKTGS
ncbi:MAG: nucleoside hydrolase, partial [Bdellovibrionales bacterium]